MEGILKDSYYSKGNLLTFICGELIKIVLDLCTKHNKVFLIQI